MIEAEMRRGPPAEFLGVGPVGEPLARVAGHRAGRRHLDLPQGSRRHGWAALLSAAGTGALPVSPELEGTIGRHKEDQSHHRYEPTRHGRAPPAYPCHASPPSTRPWLTPSSRRAEPPSLARALYFFSPVRGPDQRLALCVPRHGFFRGWGASVRAPSKGGTEGSCGGRVGRAGLRRRCRRGGRPAGRIDTSSDREEARPGD